MNPRFPLFAAAALLLAVPAPAPGVRAAEDPPREAPAPDAGAEDVLLLRDGREIRGRIAAEDDTAYAVRMAGVLRVVEKKDVAEVRRAPRPEPAPAGGEGGDGGGRPDRKAGDRRDRRRRGGDPGKGEPEGAGPGREVPGGDGPGMDGPPRAARDSELPPSLPEEVRAWATACIERLLSADPLVQRSAAAALRALGPGVLPLLREARERAGGDGRRILDRIAASLEGDPPPGADGGDGRRVLKRILDDLDLDEPQARAVGRVLLEVGRAAADLARDVRDGILTPEDARARGAEHRAGMRASLEGVLPEEKLDRLDRLLDEAAGRPGKGR